MKRKDRTGGYKTLYNDVMTQFTGGKWESQAAGYLGSTTKMRTLLGMVLAMFKMRALAPVLKDLALLYLYVRDIIDRRYRTYDRGRLVVVVAVLLYVVSPFDLVPDFLAGIGLLDDAMLITYVIRLCHKELSRYNKWRKARRSLPED